MNNQYKRDKKAKIERLNKVKKIGFIISLVFNGLFILLLIIGLALPKDSASEPKNEQNNVTKVMRQTNKLASDYLNNDYVVGYDLLWLKNIDQDTTGSIVTGVGDYNYYVVSGSSYIQNTNYLKVVYNLHAVPVNGDYYRIAFYQTYEGLDTDRPLIARSFVYASGDWNITDTMPYNETPTYSSWNGFKFFLNTERNANSSFNMSWLLTDFFDEISYEDYDLNYNWSPYAYYNSIYGVYEGTIENDWYLIKNGVFSVYGEVYTDLIMDWTGNSAVTGGYLDVNVDWGQEIELERNKPYSWVVSIYAKNSINNKVSVLWSLPSATYNTEGAGYALVLHTLNATFNDKNKALIRLFDYNSEESVAGGYVNGNALGVAYDYSNIGTGGVAVVGVTNVLTLFTKVFDTMGSVFGLVILPGITLGTLIFIPLIAIVVFALIKVLKK